MTASRAIWLGLATLAAAWGVLIWKEFSGAPKSVNKLISAMFTLFIAGLAMIILAKV